MPEVRKALSVGGDINASMRHDLLYMTILHPYIRTTSSMLYLGYYPEHGNSTFRNVDTYLPDYTALYPTRQY